MPPKRISSTRLSRLGSLRRWLPALAAAGLVDTLKGPGPFTVFAPTDAAFAKLPAGTVDTLLKPENKAKLTAILTYHVVPGKVMAADVVKLTEAKTVEEASSIARSRDTHRRHDRALPSRRASDRSRQLVPVAGERQDSSEGGGRR